MKERYKTNSAVFLLATFHHQIGWQKRKNTGFMDGYYDLLVSGHVEEGESLSQAMVREAKEECGLELDAEKLELVTVIHSFLHEEPYYYFYFHVELSKEQLATIAICEPEKIEALYWLSDEECPSCVGEHNRVALQNWKSNCFLGELGF